MRLPGPLVHGVLSPYDRGSEMLFGLIMALTITGALSVTSATPQETQALFVSTLSCNVAWGLVDAVMYVLNSVLGRGRKLLLDRALREGADPAELRTLLTRTSTRRRGSRGRTSSRRSACSWSWWPAPSRWRCPSC
jgi:hypothetical protein